MQSNDKINSLDELIINEIRLNKYITIPELASSLNKGEATIYRHIYSLIKDNKLKRIGSRKTGYYEIFK